MSEEEKIDCGRIVLADAYIPALSHGRYTISVRQELSEGAKIEIGKIRQEKFVFTCEAGGLTLDGDEIYSVYPPKDSYGLFEMVIPHLILKKRTLPWEYGMAIDGVPWLVLLLFSEEEPVKMISDDVTRAFAVDRETYCPVTLPKPGYTEGTTCLALEVAADLFCRVCPSVGELPLMAHTRCVSRKNKTADQNFVEDWLSVLVGNRFPRSGDGEKGLKNTVYMVSLADFGDFLTSDTLRREVAAMETYKKVRVPLLSSWSFYSKNQEFDFINCFRRLHADSLLLRMEKPGEAFSLLQRGYVALNHELRDGGRTVSFYHGPFRPCELSLKKEKYQIFPDARLIYEPELGMFDVSMSTAAALGRMLGLKERVFSKALLQFRGLNQVRAEENYYKAAVLPAGFGADLQEKMADKSQEAPVMKVLNERVRNVLISASESAKLGKNSRAEQSGRTEAMGSPWRTGQNEEETAWSEDSLRVKKEQMVKEQRYFSFLQEPSVVIPKEITDYLARLSLFYDVPFSYLVPDERMLPQEQIRFFRIDHEWMFALLDGAMSLGRSFDTDYAQDAMIIERLLNKIYRKRCEIRPLLQRESPERIALLADDGFRAMEEFVSTGFLLRSELVSGFRGMEFLAFQKEGDLKPLPCLRLEAIGSEILLGIFAGECNYLEIRQPPEGMHFGVERGEQGELLKRMRSLDTGELYEEEGHMAKIAMRDEEQGILDFCATALEIGRVMNINKVSSVHLALEMIQNPATGIIKVL